MGYMDMLKSAMGMNDEPQQVNQDGKNYTFTPGKNGSLTAPAPSTDKELVNTKPVSKTVPMKPVLIASARG